MGCQASSSITPIRSMTVTPSVKIVDNVDTIDGDYAFAYIEYQTVDYNRKSITQYLKIKVKIPTYAITKKISADVNEFAHDDCTLYNSDIGIVSDLIYGDRTYFNSNYKIGQEIYNINHVSNPNIFLMTTNGILENNCDVKPFRSTLLAPKMPFSAYIENSKYEMYEYTSTQLTFYHTNGTVNKTISIQIYDGCYRYNGITISYHKNAKPHIMSKYSNGYWFYDTYVFDVNEKLISIIKNYGIYKADHSYVDATPEFILKLFTLLTAWW